MHKAFVGREDAVKNLFNLCTSAGLTPIVYYSLIYNNWAYDVYPDWRMRNVQGKGSRDGGNRYGLCCPNNQEYRDFVTAQIAEFCEYFDFNGIWLDMTFWPMVCYCSSCKKRWEAEIGGEMPNIIDWDCPKWNNFQSKREQWLDEFAQFATKEVLKHNPNRTVTHQYSPASEYWRYGVNENVSKASEYASGDFYGGFAEQSFACKLYYGLTQNQPFEYMTSRCHPNLWEHTSNKTMDQLRLGVYVTYAHHGACLLIDGIDPRGTVDAKVYEKIGQVFNESVKYEPYLSKGDLVQDVGVFYSLRNKMDTRQKGVSVDSSASTNRMQPHLKAAEGAVAALRSHHIPVGVINNWKLEDISKVKVLVLPDVTRISHDEKKAIFDYVRNGGKLYLSGQSSIELAEELLGMKYEGFTDELFTYIAPTDAGKVFMDEYSCEYPMAVFAKQAKLSGMHKGTIFGTITLPYTLPLADPAWASGCEYGHIEESEAIHPPFASIHSNPPGISTDYPAIVKANYGKGCVVWASTPIEAQNRYQHRKIFARLIMDLLDKPSFSAEGAPEVVELVMFEDADAKYLSIINLQDTFEVINVHGFNTYVKMDAAPKRVLLLPTKEELSFEYVDGYAKIPVNNLHIFKMLVIEK